MNSEESGPCVKEIVECIESLSHPNEIKQTETKSVNYLLTVKTIIY